MRYKYHPVQELHMKHKTAFSVTISLILVLSVLDAMAQITVPGSDGSDGELHITESTTIDLSDAVTGKWDDDNAAHAGKGIYDPDKWAIVFKYTRVTIDSGRTLSFKNHPSRAARRRKHARAGCRFAGHGKPRANARPCPPCCCLRAEPCGASKP